MPGDAVQFLSVDEVLAIQERLIDRFGGDHGVRDKGLLESVLIRTQTGYYTHIETPAFGGHDFISFPTCEALEGHAH